MNREMRTLESKFQTREENEEKRIEGYSSLFDGMSESIDSHAFDNTLSGDVRALINHDTTLVLGTVDMRTDAHDLSFHFKKGEKNE